MVQSETILRGVMLGVASVVIGWLKSGKPGNFQLQGLFLKLPVGAVVGIVAEVYGLSLDSATELLAGLGVIEGLDGLMKTVVRRFHPKFMTLPRSRRRWDDGMKEMSERILSMLVNGQSADAIKDTAGKLEKITISVMNKRGDDFLRDSVLGLLNKVVLNVNASYLNDTSYKEIGQAIATLYLSMAFYASNRNQMVRDALTDDIRLTAVKFDLLFTKVNSEKKT